MKAIDSAIKTFELNIEGVRQIQLIYDYLDNQQVNDLDLSELLRAEIALAVSALDCFIHDVVRLGTVEIYSGNRPFTSKTFQPNFDPRKFVSLLTKSKDEQIQELENAIRLINKESAFQKPEKIANALLSIGVENIWTSVAGKLGISEAKEVEDELDIIINRRNVIVHEGDIDYQTEQKRNIDKDEVKKNIDFINSVCVAIFNIVVTTTV